MFKMKAKRSLSPYLFHSLYIYNYSSNLFVQCAFKQTQCIECIDVNI